ncbi:MAG: alpha/beta family hydrolase [Planctomycetota bacterium]
MSQRAEFTFEGPKGPLSAILDLPEDPSAVFALAHGPGADNNHRLFESNVPRLLGRSIGVFRYQFPYTEAGKRGPDRAPTLQASVRAALETLEDRVADLPIVAGGKSMGGRMTSLEAAAAPLPSRVRGVAFLGFPLHAAGKPATSRGEHLSEFDLPLLFVQGTRDKLADLDLLKPIVEGLGERATLHIVESGDHSFHVLKRSGRTDDEALDEVADAVASWVDGLSL